MFRTKFSILCIALSLIIVAGVSTNIYAAETGAWQNYDFGGETIKLSLHFTTVTPLGARDSFDWYNPDPRLRAHIDSVEQQFNCKIEFVEPNTVFTIVPAIMEGVFAGDEPFVTSQLRTRDIVPLALEGFLLPLDDYIEPEYWGTLPPELRSAEESLKILGNLYAFPLQGPYWNGTTGIVFNKTIFETEALPNPYELYAAGEWTWENYQNIARLATRDTSGDGNIDQFGGYINQHHRHHWFAANNAPLYKEIDGRIVFTLTDEAVLDTLEFLRSLDQDNSARSYGRAPAIRAGAIAMVEEYVHILSQWTHTESYGNFLIDEFEWGIVPYPKGPNATEHIAPEYGWVYGGVFPVNVQHNPRAIIEVCNALHQITEPYIYDMDEWQEDFWSDRVTAVFDRESLEIWHWLEENAALYPDPVIRHILEVVNINAAWDSVIIHGESPAAAMAQIQPVAQALLDEALNQ